MASSSLTIAATVATLLTSLCVTLTYTRATPDATLSRNKTSGYRGYRGYGVQDAWGSIMWTRFPMEAFPLYLTPYIEAGKIEEAQRKSRVRGLLHDDVESYSGYITVDKRYQSNMFFWFFPAEVPDGAPVLLWLNGGPGRTSMVGAMLENGPLELIHAEAPRGRRKNTEKSYIVKRREISWTKLFSMIYVDNPVGVGYSYTRDDAGLSTSMDDVSRNLYSVLTQFFKMFPEFSENEFYIGGQSYAGKYVPSLGYYIHQQNHGQHPPDVHINFKGIYLGAGYCSPEKMMPVFPDFLFNMGFISDYRRRELRETYTKLIRDGLSGKNLLSPSEYLHRFFSKPSYSANHVLGSEATVTSKLHLVDIWMNEASTRAALHVAWARYPKVYAHSYVVRNSLKHEFLQDTVRENAFLMDNYKVLHYSGNLDVIVNVPMTEAFLSSVPWSGQAAYNRSDLTPWWIGKVVGYFTQIANFTRVIVRNSGHMLPYDTPEWALKMMERFVFDIPFETNAHYMDYYS